MLGTSCKLSEISSKMLATSCKLSDISSKMLATSCVYCFLCIVVYETLSLSDIPNPNLN